MIKMVAEVLAIWLILSCPLGVLVGKILHSCATSLPLHNQHPFDEY